MSFGNLNVDKHFLLLSHPSSGRAVNRVPAGGTRSLLTACDSLP